MAEPPDVDLSDILKRVVSRSEPVRAASRRRLANDQVTRAFLEAGLRLLTGHHGEEVQGDAEDARERPFFNWLSVSRVREEAARSGMHVTDNDHRYRWPARDDYIEDLLAYSLWEGHWPAAAPMTEELKGELHEGDFVDSIHQLAYANMRDVADSMAFRVGVIASAMAKDDSLILEASDKTYASITNNWGHLYQSIMEERGLKLREGITLEEFTMLLTALADGLSLRMAAQPHAPVVDHENQRSLLGKGALAMVMAFLDPGDGLSAEEVVRMVQDTQAEDS